MILRVHSVVAAVYRVNMSRQIRILELSDVTLVHEFSRRGLREKISNEMEREMFSWNAAWREESLRHYLSTGWSVGVFEADELKGYFLAQPILFMGNLTQVLWIEHLEATLPQDQDLLLDTATRYAREKHLQSVLQNHGDWKISEIKTTKR